MDLQQKFENFKRMNESLAEENSKLQERVNELEDCYLTILMKLDLLSVAKAIINLESVAYRKDIIESVKGDI
uniref:Uncharacterized protein n=1 Tax=viral metagenome TaxID=1070528 RepID=A0A6M3JNG2_9ZZZZ